MSDILKQLSPIIRSNRYLSDFRVLLSDKAVARPLIVIRDKTVLIPRKFTPAQIVESFPDLIAKAQLQFEIDAHTKNIQIASDEAHMLACIHEYRKIRPTALKRILQEEIDA